MTPKTERLMGMRLSEEGKDTVTSMETGDVLVFDLETGNLSMIRQPERKSRKDLWFKREGGKLRSRSRDVGVKTREHAMETAAAVSAITGWDYHEIQRGAVAGRVKFRFAGP